MHTVKIQCIHTCTHTPTHSHTHECVHQHSVLNSLVNHRREAFQGFCLTLLLRRIKINKKEAEGNTAVFQMTVRWSNSKTIGDDNHEFDDVDYVTAVFAEELEMAQLDSKQYLVKINSLEGQFCFFLSRMFQVLWCSWVLTTSFHLVFHFDSRHLSSCFSYGLIGWLIHWLVWF